MKNTMKLLAGCALGLSMALPASASLTLSLTPSSQRTSIGGTASYDVMVSGLKYSSDYNGPALGGFSLFLNFDSSIASVASVSFGSMLSLTQPDFTYSDTSVAGQLYLSEISYDSAQDLEKGQPSGFKLATIVFQGLNLGNTTITFDQASSLSDESGGMSLDITSATGGNLTVVPEANFGALSGLLAVAGLGIVAWRSRSNAAQLN